MRLILNGGHGVFSDGNPWFCNPTISDLAQDLPWTPSLSYRFSGNRGAFAPVAAPCRDKRRERAGCSRDPVARGGPGGRRRAASQWPFHTDGIWFSACQFEARGQVKGPVDCVCKEKILTVAAVEWHQRGQDQLVMLSKSARQTMA